MYRNPALLGAAESVQQNLDRLLHSDLHNRTPDEEINIFEFYGQELDLLPCPDPIVNLELGLCLNRASVGWQSFPGLRSDIFVAIDSMNETGSYNFTMYRSGEAESFSDYVLEGIELTCLGAQRASKESVSNLILSLALGDEWFDIHRQKPKEVSEGVLFLDPQDLQIEKLLILALSNRARKIKTEIKHSLELEKSDLLVNLRSVTENELDGKKRVNNFVDISSKNYYEKDDIFNSKFPTKIQVEAGDNCTVKIKGKDAMSDQIRELPQDMVAVLSYVETVILALRRKFHRPIISI